jgi:hypothetical protein
VKHEKALFTSIWVIAIGMALLISGLAVGGSMGINYMNAFIVGGIVGLVFGFFGIITTLLKETLDRETAPDTEV